jgi:hypothetical protein
MFRAVNAVRSARSSILYGKASAEDMKMITTVVVLVEKIGGLKEQTHDTTNG